MSIKRKHRKTVIKYPFIQIKGLKIHQENRKVTNTIALWFYQTSKPLQGSITNISYQYNSAKVRVSGAIGISQNKLNKCRFSYTTERFIVTHITLYPDLFL